MQHRERGGGVQIDDEVTVGDRIHRVVRDAVEAELACDRLTVDGVRHAGQSARAEREHVGASARLRHAFAVAREHRLVRLQVMREQYRLGALCVCVAGHDRARLALRDIE